MVRKKNKRQAQPTLSASITVTDTELRELIHQSFIVDEVHDVLEYDQKACLGLTTYSSFD